MSGSNERKLLFAILVLTCGIFVAQASGETVSFHLAGHIEVEDHTGLLTVEDGMPFEAVWTYDTAAPRQDTFAVRTNGEDLLLGEWVQVGGVGKYTYASDGQAFAPAFGLTFLINGLTITATPNIPQIVDVFVENDRPGGDAIRFGTPPRGDANRFECISCGVRAAVPAEMYVWSPPSGPITIGDTVIDVPEERFGFMSPTLSLRLADSTGQALDTDALPTDLLVNDFAEREIVLHGWNDVTTGLWIDPNDTLAHQKFSQAGHFSVRGRIESISIEPRAAQGITGDFNGDRLLTAIDIDLLTAEVIARANNATFDLNADGTVDQADRVFWVSDLKKTYFGDSDLDGEFNSGDLIAVFQAGEYEDTRAANSTWATGDWNGDAEFASDDLVLALRSGSYALNSDILGQGVPEPASLALLSIASLWILAVARRSRIPTAFESL